MTRRFFNGFMAAAFIPSFGIGGCGDAGSGVVGPIPKETKSPTPEVDQAVVKDESSSTSPR
jgi:hypothetical protein